MGSLEGHVLPGTFMIMFSFWWTWAIAKRYFRAIKLSKLQPELRIEFRSSATYSAGSTKQPKCIEGWFKLIGFLIGFTGEIYTGYENNQFKHFGNLQHCTMYLFYGISGLIDILLHRKSCGVILPKNLDYAALILASIMESLLFFFHLHGRSHLDIMVHTLLLYTIIASIVVILCEMRWRDNVLIAYCRPFLTFVHGSWFCSVGVILHTKWGNDHFIPDNHNHMMVATCIYTWHYLVALVVMSIIISIASCVMRCDSSWQPCNNNTYRRIPQKDKPLTLSVDDVDNGKPKTIFEDSDEDK